MGTEDEWVTERQHEREDDEGRVGHTVTNGVIARPPESPTGRVKSLKFKVYNNIHVIFLIFILFYI